MHYIKKNVGSESPQLKKLIIQIHLNAQVQTKASSQNSSANLYKQPIKGLHR